MTEKSLQTRPPIVAILGHVDHGKTTLLDYIRKTKIASKEAGGITQSIGAWQAKTPKGGIITFIDTPGHELFSEMRLRGAQAADIVVLVVAADDGVMPQTRESLAHIRQAAVPFAVAITKTDLPSAEPERVKNQLTEEGILLEGRGGDVVVVEVSGKTGQGVDSLLEMLELLAEISEVKADPAAPASAVVIETLRDRRGPVVRSIVTDGTLRVGDEVKAVDKLTGKQFGAKIRGMFDENQKSAKEALPGMPIEILGFDELPPAGTTITTGEAEKEKEEPPTGRIPQRPPKGFLVIIKADTAGRLEAVESSLPEGVVVVLKGLGDVVENDILMAGATGAVILGFNIKVDKAAKNLGETSNITIRTYNIIYELVQDLEEMVKKASEPEEKVVGSAQIIAEFPHGKERIAGVKILSGRITKSDKMRLVRQGEQVGDIKPVSIRKQKDFVDKVETGTEAGIHFRPQFDFKIGDVIESYSSQR